MNDDEVWVVTCFNEEELEEPITMAFSNEEAANNCFDYFSDIYNVCYLDVVYVADRFPF